MEFWYRNCRKLFIFTLLVVLWLLIKSSNAGWAKIILPGDDPIDTKETPHVVKKVLKLSKRTIETALTELEYDVTQKMRSDPPESFFYDFNSTGTYHWVVCDQVLFNHTEKFKLDDEGDLAFPQFNRPIGNLTYSTWTNEGHVFERFHWEDWGSFIGDVVEDYDAMPLLKRWVCNSSAMWFDTVPDPEQEKMIEELTYLGPTKEEEEAFEARVEKTYQEDMKRERADRVSRGLPPDEAEGEKEYVHDYHDGPKHYVPDPPGFLWKKDAGDIEEDKMFEKYRNMKLPPEMDDDDGRVL